MAENQKWGRVSIDRDKKGHLEVILENSRIFCRYGYKKVRIDEKSIEPDIQSFIIDLTLKTVNENQVGLEAVNENRIDAAAWRGILTNASIICDQGDKKTVRLTWKGWEGPDPVIQEVSIFKDSPYLKIDYNEWCVNIVDIADPGGCKMGEYEIFGAYEWKREYVFHHKTYYNGSDNDCGCDIPKESPGPLVYKGHFIMGVYNRENGRGFGRVVPEKDIDIIKLLWGKGFELFPQFGRLPHKPFSSYLYVVMEGREEILAVGKQLADLVPGDID